MPLNSLSSCASLLFNVCATVSRLISCGICLNSQLGNLPNPKLNMQPCGGDHIHERVETELVDFAA